MSGSTLDFRAKKPLLLMSLPSGMGIAERNLKFTKLLGYNLTGWGYNRTL
jgi:hypothetical protein